jgi:hypothetical protein
MNSNLVERRAFTAKGCFASLRYRTIFCQNYQFAIHRLASVHAGPCFFRDDSCLVTSFEVRS